MNKPTKPRAHRADKELREILNSIYLDGHAATGEFNPVIANGTVDIALKEIKEYFETQQNKN